MMIWCKFQSNSHILYSVTAPPPFFWYNVLQYPPPRGANMVFLSTVSNNFKLSQKPLIQALHISQVSNWLPPLVFFSFFFFGAFQMGERCLIFNLLIKSKCDVKKRSAYTPITSTFTFQGGRLVGCGVMWRRGRCTSLQVKLGWRGMCAFSAIWCGDDSDDPLTFFSLSYSANGRLGRWCASSEFLTMSVRKGRKAVAGLTKVSKSGTRRWETDKRLLFTNLNIWSSYLVGWTRTPPLHSFEKQKNNPRCRRQSPQTARQKSVNHASWASLHFCTKLNDHYSTTPKEPKKGMDQ